MYSNISKWLQHMAKDNPSRNHAGVLLFLLPDWWLVYIFVLLPVLDQPMARVITKLPQLDLFSQCQGHIFSTLRSPQRLKRSLRHGKVMALKSPVGPSGRPLGDHWGPTEAQLGACGCWNLSSRDVEPIWISWWLADPLAVAAKTMCKTKHMV